MIELGLQQDDVHAWFVVGAVHGYTRISVPPAQAATWAELLRDAVRRAYISDATLEERAHINAIPRTEVLAAKLPSAGPVMSGDFGEIVGYLYLASANGGAIVGPKRWRLKQDRTKPAPGSDIVQFLLPHWPTPTANDRLICGEVKAKATPGVWNPINASIEGMTLDRTSRLGRTLVWLREQAILGDIGAVTIPQLDRFIDATEHPAYTREFYAITVICSSLLNNQLLGFVPPTIPLDCALIVIDVPHLRDTYTAVYEAVHASVVDVEPEDEGGI